MYLCIPLHVYMYSFKDNKKYFTQEYMCMYSEYSTYLSTFGYQNPGDPCSRSKVGSPWLSANGFQSPLVRSQMHFCSVTGDIPEKL